LRGLWCGEGGLSAVFRWILEGGVGEAVKQPMYYQRWGKYSTHKILDTKYKHFYNHNQIQNASFKITFQFPENALPKY
jgi:hypothetical protein